MNEVYNKYSESLDEIKLKVITVITKKEVIFALRRKCRDKANEERNLASSQFARLTGKIIGPTISHKLRTSKHISKSLKNKLNV